MFDPLSGATEKADEGDEVTHTEITSIPGSL